MRRSIRLIGLTLAAAAALALTACSSGSLSGGGSSSGGSSSGGASTEDLTPVTVGLLQIAPSAAVQFGIDEGIFAKHGLDVTTQLGQGGAALLPAVSSGSIQFAVGNPLSVLVASSQGLGMNIIAGFSSVDVPADKPPTGVLVLKDSGIASWKDLVGKTVAVNALNTQGDLTIKGAVEADGGDPDQVKFTEIAFPDQLPQLEQGHIDAAWVPEPFVAQGLANENVMLLGESMGAAIPGLYSMVTFTSSSYAEQNPEIVDAFRDAVTESLALASSDDAAYRDAITAFTGMPAETVANLNLEKLSGELDPSIIQSLSDMALKYGFLSSAPDLDQVILTK